MGQRSADIAWKLCRVVEWLALVPLGLSIHGVALAS